jgi:hypothetical protein
MEEETSGEILKIKAETTRKIESIRDETKRDRKRDAYFWMVMVLTSVIGPSLALAGSAYNTRQSERKFCAIMGTSVSQAQARLEAFLAAPPDTAAGKAQQTRAEEGLMQLADLQRSLGCPIDEG